MSNEKNTIKASDPLAEILSKPEIQASIASALEKLPGVLEKYDAFDRMVTFANEVLKDGASMEYLLSGLRGDLPPVQLNRETLESAVILLDKLPKIAKYVQMMEQLFDTVESVATDKQSLEYLVNGAKEMVEPWNSKIRDGLSVVQEAQKRAAKDHSSMTLFSLLKLIKDPSMQKGLHLVKAFLTILEERDTAPSSVTNTKNVANKGFTAQM